jgi:hypothetical protein
MFSNELVVTYPATTGPCQACVFVPISKVRREGEHGGAVRVAVAVEDGVSYALLPTDYGDIVKVDSADLTQQ